MNLDNIVSKIQSNSDKLGTILGFTTGSMNGFNDVVSSIENIMSGHIHMPDLAAAFQSIGNEPFVKSGVMVAIGGYILKEVDLNPTLNKIGTMAEKGGIGYAIGAVINKLLWSSTHSGEFRGGGGGPSGNYGY